MKKEHDSSKNASRRKFIKTTALSAGMIGAFGSLDFIKASPITKDEKSNSNDLQLKLAHKGFITQ